MIVVRTASLLALLLPIACQGTVRTTTALPGRASAGPSSAGPTKAGVVEASYRDLDGKTHRPLDIVGAKAHVLIFITTDCPIANQYSPCIQRLVAAHKADPVRFFLVHVDPGVTEAAARKHAKEYGHTCTILCDTRHRLVKHTGVQRTPEAVVITPDGQTAYRGRIDNWYGDVGRKRPQPTKHELAEAIAAVLAGREVQVKRTDAIGCFVPTID